MCRDWKAWLFLLLKFRWGFGSGSFSSWFRSEMRLTKLEMWSVMGRSSEWATRSEYCSGFMEATELPVFYPLLLPTLAMLSKSALCRCSFGLGIWAIALSCNKANKSGWDALIPSKVCAHLPHFSPPPPKRLQCSDEFSTLASVFYLPCNTLMPQL